MGAPLGNVAVDREWDMGAPLGNVAVDREW
jgi:hypothetical protein